MFQTITYRKIALFFLLWCLWWTLLQTLALQYTFGFGWGVSAGDAFITNLIIAFAGYDMILVMRFYQPRQVVRIGMSMALAVLCVLAVRYLIVQLISESPEFVAFMDSSMVIRGLYIWLMIALISTVSWLWFTLQDREASRARKDDMEKLARDAELMRLRQQLHPHFLFNSLNSISALAGAKPEEARRMVQQLSDFLRGTLRKDDQQLVTLSEEFEHLQLYLDIEKVRFGHRLRVVHERDDAALAMKLPPLLLQPVVENAIKFGLYDTTGETLISIRATVTKGMLLLTVENPFDPSTASPKQGTGFGLSSVQRRLYLLYARNDLLETKQSGQTFITSIKIPQLV